MKATYYIGTLILTLGVLATIFVYLMPMYSLGQGLSNGALASDCEISTYTKVGIGNQTAVQLLASHGRRAWAQVDLPISSEGVATNTVSLGLGVTATLNAGTQLATSTNTFVFGLNTDMPFTGSVSAITSNGSTSIRVTECRY